MKIEFSNEDIGKIRRIVRQEILKFISDCQDKIVERVEKDVREDLK